MRSRTKNLHYHHRRGAIYLVVLGMGTLVSVMVFGVLVCNRLTVRQVSADADAIEAEALAESTVDFALAKMAANPNWRTTYTNGVRTPPVSIGSGLSLFWLVDESTGSLTSNPADPVRIYGMGIYGKAIKVYSVQAAGNAGLTCLSAALATTGALTVDLGSIRGLGYTVASNGNFAGATASPSMVNCNLQATGSITANSSVFSGTKTTGSAALNFPASTAFSYYTTNGQSIAYSSIPGGVIQNVLISPNSNPYALLGLGLNPNGIYVIDCQNQVLKITSCRIVGTLVILNPGAGSSIGTGGGTGDNIYWTPAVSNYPCLMVSGNMTMAFAGGGSNLLNEASTGVNFNPLLTPYPYPSGSIDLTTTTTYPSLIDGLVYVSGNLTGGAGSTPAVDVLVVGGSYDLGKDTISLSYNSSFLTTPPPGFVSGGGPVIPVVSSWKWEKEE